MLWLGSNAFLVFLYITSPFVVIYVLIMLLSIRRGGRGVQVLRGRFVGYEFAWLLLVGVIWTAINIVSFSWIPGGVGQPLLPIVGEEQKVEIEAFMWGYNISTQTLRSGIPVRFVMWSIDTMHSVGIYDPDENLIATVMLMPGMREQIILTLKPGTYTIRCLEYCGPGHPFMSAVLEVV